MAAVSGPRFGRKCEYYSDNAAAAHIVSVMSETIRRHTSYCHRNEVVSKLREKFNKYFWPRDECGPKIKQFVAEAPAGTRQLPDHKLVCLQRNLQKIYKSMNLCSDCGVGDGDVSSSLLLFTRFSSVATFTCSERRRGSRRKEILVVTHQPGPAPSHADNIQINFLFLMEFFTTCKCL